MLGPAAAANLSQPGNPFVCHPPNPTEPLSPCSRLFRLWILLNVQRKKQLLFAGPINVLLKINTLPNKSIKMWSHLGRKCARFYDRCVLAGTVPKRWTLFCEPHARQARLLNISVSDILLSLERQPRGHGYWFDCLQSHVSLNMCQQSQVKWDEAVGIMTADYHGCCYIFFQKASSFTTLKVTKQNQAHSSHHLLYFYCSIKNDTK